MKTYLEDDELKRIAEFTSDMVVSKMKSLPVKFPEEEKYLTRTETAQKLHVTLPCLAKYTRNGKITGYRFGNRVLYKKSEIDRALEQIPSIKFRRNK